MDSNPEVKTAAPAKVPLTPAWRENENYRDGFHMLVWISNIQILIILVLVVCFAFYVKTVKRQDNFFAETAEGRKMQMVGLALPNMGKTAMSLWVSQAATQIMTFGFNDIDQRFELSQHNFTADGWKSFQKAMVDSGLVGNILKTQQILTSVPQGEPELTWEGLDKGKYRWFFNMKMLITFRSGSAKTVATKVVRMVLEQVPTSDNPAAIGIAEWYIY